MRNILDLSQEKYQEAQAIIDKITSKEHKLQLIQEWEDKYGEKFPKVYTLNIEALNLPKNEDWVQVIINPGRYTKKKIF